jgi:hypothetical protein
MLVQIRGLPLTRNSLIAIMLGRLRMSVEDCITAYIRLSSRVFQKKHAFPVKISGKIKARYSSEELRRAIEDVVEANHLDKDTLLKDTSPQACKVFVAVRSAMYADSVSDSAQVRVRDEQWCLPPFPLTELSTDPRDGRSVPQCQDMGSRTSYFRRFYFLRTNCGRFGRPAVSRWGHRSEQSYTAALE